MGGATPSGMAQRTMGQQPTGQTNSFSSPLGMPASGGSGGPLMQMIMQHPQMMQQLQPPQQQQSPQQPYGGGFGGLLGQLLQSGMFRQQ